MLGLVIGGGIVIRLTRSPTKDAPFTGLFNVAVVSFGTINSETGAINKTAADDLLTSMLVDEIDLNIVDLPGFDPSQIQFRRVHADPIQGQTDKDRSLAAAALATRLNADVVVYGYLEITNPDAGVQVDNAELYPRFYIGPRLGGASEISGDDAFGAPIPINTRIVNDTQNRASLRREFVPRINAMARFLYGLAFFRTGDYDFALEQFNLADDVEGWEKDQGKEVLYLWFGTLFERAHLFDFPADKLLCPPPFKPAEDLGDDRLACALAAYQSAISLDDHFARAYLGVGNIYMDIGDLNGPDQCAAYVDGAVSAYDTARMLTERNDQLLLIQTKALYSLGYAYQNAYTLGCEDNPSYSNIDMLGEAVTYLTQASKNYDLLKDEPEAHELQANVQYQLGLVYTRQGVEQYAAALDAYQKVLNLAEPEDLSLEETWQEIRWSAHYRRAFLLSQMAKYEFDLETATDLWKQTLNESQAVIDAYVAGRFTDPDSVGGAYYFAGLAYEGLRDVDAACGALETVLSIDPENGFYDRLAQEELDFLNC